MKKFFGGLFLLLVLFSLVGCFPVYEDTNGAEDYTLQSLTEADIISGGTYSKAMSSTITVNDKTVCKAKAMSGVETLFEQRLKNEAFEILVSCEILKGNARLVLVVDGEIVYDFALNESNQRFTLKNVSGDVSLRLAGESVGYSVTYEIS